MTAPVYIPFYVGDYLRDTQHLTAAEHGAYLLLLMACWTRGGTLPDDDRQLAVITKSADQNEWQKRREILAPFFKISHGKWQQKRLSFEFKNAKKLRGSRSDAGTKGAAKRWEQKQKTYNGKANGGAYGKVVDLPLANEIPFSPSPPDPLTLTSPNPNPEPEIPTPQSPPSRRGGAGRRGRSEKSPREIQAQAFFEVAHELAAARNRNC